MQEILNQINKGQTLDEIILLFEQMCQIPIKDDLLLFETGVFDFTGEDLYYFCLVRQYPNEDDEYYQIHVDILYKPHDLYNNINEQAWSDEVNYFDYIRKSKIYDLLKNQEIDHVEVYIDET